MEGGGGEWKGGGSEWKGGGGEWRVVVAVSGKIVMIVRIAFQTQKEEQLRVSR